MRKIIIAGGSGFLGSCLANHFEKSKEDQLIILTRGKSRVVGNVEYIQWDGKSAGPWANVLEGATAVINLNGKSVDCRYTEKNKALIYSTRLDSTAAIGMAIQKCQNPPKLWINAASATIYRHSLDQEMDEYRGEIGTGFSVDVCKKWEATFHEFATAKTRKVLIRTGIVLGRSGGPMTPLKALTRMGVGGRQGTGNQYVSWLHEDDFVNIIEFILARENVSGAVNVTAPVPVPNVQFMKALRATLKVKVGIPLPKGLLEIGAFLIRTEAELILKSRRVIPTRLQEAGFTFAFPEITGALADLNKRW